MKFELHKDVDEDALEYAQYVIVATDMKDKHDYIMGYAETSGDARFSADELREAFKGDGRYRDWAIVEYL